MPEEINRVMTDHVSQLLFAPTATAVKNLSSEGVTQGVVLTGDVMCDAILRAKEEAGKRTPSLCERFGVDAGGYVLSTIHRAGNTDIRANLQGILAGLGAAPMPVILPCHPRTRAVIENGQFRLASNVRLVDPLCYVDTIALQMGAAVIATDSGGMQKEAYILGVPCVTLREETEWVETVEAGWNVLAGTDTGRIAKKLADFRPEGDRASLFGDGRAAAAVVGHITEWLSQDRPS